MNSDDSWALGSPNKLVAGGVVSVLAGNPEAAGTDGGVMFDPNDFIGESAPKRFEVVLTLGLKAFATV